MVVSPTILLQIKSFFRSEKPRKERLALLDVIIHLLRVDLEFWWKHLRKKTKEKPLIEYLFESKEVVAF
jgi:hypothetical protein